MIDILNVDDLVHVMAKKENRSLYKKKNRIQINYTLYNI